MIETEHRRNFFETSNGRLPLEDGSDRPQTLEKRVSGDPRHFIFRCSKHVLRQIYLSQFVCANTPKIVSAKRLFWRSCAGLDINGECSSKSHCQSYKFQPSTTLGGGIRKAKTVFGVSFGLTKTYTFFDECKTMIL